MHVIARNVNLLFYDFLPGSTRMLLDSSIGKKISSRHLNTYLDVVPPLDELHLVREDDVEEDVAQVRLGAHHHLRLAVVPGHRLDWKFTE